MIELRAQRRSFVLRLTPNSLSQEALIGVVLQSLIRDIAGYVVARSMNLAARLEFWLFPSRALPL